MSRKILVVLAIGLIYLFAIFALFPGLDLALAGLFYRNGQFIGRIDAGQYLRRFFYDAPYLIFGAFLLAYVAKKFFGAPQGPRGRQIIFLIATLALGPGLLVNGVLKEVSHRPRPEQSQNFGGPWAFQPYDSFAGACKKNCSFVSGETSFAAWTLAPALLVSPPAQTLAIGAALSLTVATGLLRMSFGGHYFSDVVFAAIFTFLIVLGGFLWLRRDNGDGQA